MRIKSDQVSETPRSLHLQAAGRLVSASANRSACGQLEETGPTPQLTMMEERLEKTKRQSCSEATSLVATPE